MLNVSVDTIERWVKIGYLKPIKFGKSYRFVKSEIEELASKNIKYRKWK